MTTHTATTSTTSTTSATTTTAVVVRAPGGPDALELVSVPAPVAGPGEVLVDVEYAGVNPVDLSTRSGFFHSVGLLAADSGPVGLGWEVVGTVVGTSTRVAALLPGIDRRTGGYAAQVVVPEADLAVVPGALSSRDAATVPLTGLTAAQLLTLAGPAGGRSMLVTGAAGAVGHYLLLLAHEAGFATTGLARASDEPLVTSAGAAFTTAITGTYDVVVDAAALVDPALEAVADGGTYLGVLPAVVPAGRPGITVAAVSVVPDGRQLADLLARAAAGTLPSRVAGVLPLAEAARAHEAIERGGVRGRYLLQP